MADSTAQDKNLPASQRKLRQGAGGRRARALARDLGALPGSRVRGRRPWWAFLRPRLSSGFSRSALRPPCASTARPSRAPALMGERLSALTSVFLWVALPLGALMMGGGGDRRRGRSPGAWVWSLEAAGAELRQAQPDQRCLPAALQAAAHRCGQGHPARLAAGGHRCVYLFRAVWRAFGADALGQAATGRPVVDGSGSSSAAWC